MRESILTQLMSSQYDYAELAHTGIIFHYGNVTINPDHFSLEQIEELELIMRKGRIAENDKIHDLGGVRWTIKAGHDLPKLFRRLHIEGFRTDTFYEIVKPYPDRLHRVTYYYKKRDFPVIPEYEEKQIELLATRITTELNRIGEVAVPLLLTGPKTCKTLF